jgi:hypothetical protein
MAEVLISPGVLATENDQSQITSQPIQAGAAIIGPTVKGRVNIPTLVTSYSQYLAAFGSTFISGSDTYTFLTSISAYNYFQNGGTSLLVTRVAQGTWTPATSSFISGSTAGAIASGSAFILETLSQGTIMNNTGAEISGSLVNGSADNFRWQIVSPNTSSGTFSLIIRQGNDTNQNPSILETYPNLSLDPNSPNYIARVIGDQTVTVQTDGSTSYLQYSGSYPNASRYVRVKSVGLKTPNYLNNVGLPASQQYQDFIPVAQSGSFGSAQGNLVTANMKMYQNIDNTNSQGVTGSDYNTALSLMSNSDEYKFNVITTPGLILENSTQTSALTDMISISENRGDVISVIDLKNYGSTIVGATSTAGAVNNSYAAAYWPWLQTTDPNTGQLVWVPASTMIPGVYAYNDRVSEAWFAPAGINRGGLGTVRQAERKLSQSDRDTLYSSKVNPIATFPGRGVVVFGQKTLQTQASALDRVNVRRLLIALKSYISQVADNLVFEQNTVATRNQFLSQVNPYLDSVQQRQGLYAFRVVMDDTNNTADVIDRNQLIGAIYLQPTKTAEFIYLNFNILPTGATFPG